MIDSLLLWGWSVCVIACIYRSVDGRAGGSAVGWGLIPGQFDFCLAFVRLLSGATYLSAWTIRCLLLSAMCVEGVSALRGCDVLAEDFAVTCPDQKRWLTRYAGTRIGGVRSRATLAHTMRSVGYSGRPEHFTMYACVYNMVRCSAQWLQIHAEPLRRVQQAFEEKYGFECAPAEAVAILKRQGVQPPGASGVALA